MRYKFGGYKLGLRSYGIGSYVCGARGWELRGRGSESGLRIGIRD